MPAWLDEALRQSAYFMPHGHCYLWLPWVLWMHVGSDLLIGAAYVGISLILWSLVRRLRLPFSPVFVAFGLFIGLCGGTHFMEIWTTWRPDYIAAGLLKVPTALASVATAIGLVYVKPQVEAVVHAARLSEERRARLEIAHSELEALFARVRELDEARTRFFANVSHELRTPLTLILAPSERLLADPALDDAQRRHARTIHANGTILLRHVDDLLDVARLEAGQARLSPQSVDVGAWLRNVAAQFESVAAPRGIELSIHAPEGVVAMLDVDKMERVVVNLLSNALKFTPAGGRVRIALGAGDPLEITVDDSGPGIAPAQRETVFERFRQADDGPTRTHGGTGLGLAIVREFVALHGGRVELGDAPEGGARFRVLLPAARADAAPSSTRAGVHGAVASAAARLELAPAPPDALPAAPHDPAGRVLVVEDNAEVRAFVAATLGDRFAVDTATDGEDALARLRETSPDLVVTDLMMPRMGGEQLIDAMRGDAALSAVPALVLTAHDDDAVRVRLLKAGVQDFLAKPFGAAELTARVSNLVAAKRAADVLRTELASLSTDLGELAREAAARNRDLQAAVQAAEIARREAEQANKVKGHFLGMVSHETRSPLTVLNLNLELLARDPAFPDALRPRLQRIERAARHMVALLENLLARARVESGRIDARAVDVDLDALAREVLEQHRDHVPDGVTLRMDPAMSMPALRTDPELLRIAIGNLVSNALKFTREGDVVLRVDALDGTHVVEVSDSGIGIDPADLARIFEPFEQLAPLRAKTAPGVGLGLSLVKALADALGGRVDVVSHPGTGSTFRIALPSGGAVRAG